MMTKAVRNYVVFVGLLSLCAVGLMATRIVPAARQWRAGKVLQGEGTVIRIPGKAVRAGAGRRLGNIAPFAEVTVSSMEASDASFAQGVADGVVDAREWLSGGRSPGAWIMLNWDKPALVEEIDLYDRISPEDNVLSGTLTFDDGRVIPVGSLPRDGRPAQIKFAPKTVSWVTFRIDSTQGNNAGLAEIMVRGILNR